MVGVESWTRDEQGWLRELTLDYKLRWDAARKALVPFGKAEAGRTTTTGETILCHIATTDVEPGITE